MRPKQGSYLYTSDVDEAVVPLRATLIAHLGRHPDNDYVRVCYVAKGWISVHRTLAKRQLVMVQRVNYITTAGFMHMATAVNLHIVRPIALYKCDGISHVAFEYVELDMLEILPLSEVEAAAFMLQVMNAVRYLTSFFIFQIDSIRVSSKGVVKIVLDYSLEPIQDLEIQVANAPYVAEYLEKTVVTLLSDVSRWSPAAMAFVSDLRSKHLPDHTHPFLVRSRGRLDLCSAATFAAGKASAVNAAPVKGV